MSTRGQMRLHDSNPAPHDTAEEHPLRHWLIVLVFACGLAFVLRLFYVESIQGIGFFRQPLSDAAVFDERAREIASGDLRGGADFVHAPLYAYFLGAVYAFLGSDPWIVRLVQAILGAASCLVLYAATRRLFDNRTALLAAILLAVYPPAIFFDGIIQKACLSLFLSTLLLLLLVQARDTDRLRRWALVGLAACFLILTRQSALVLLPLLDRKSVV